MIRLIAPIALLASPAVAQDHSMHGMTMPMPAAKPAKKSVRPAPVRKPAPATPTTRRRAPMSGMDHGAMPGMAMPEPAATPAGDQSDHAGHSMPGMTASASPVGTAPPPPVPRDNYADRTFGAAAMAPARARMMRENGGRPFGQILFNLAEYQARGGRDGYRWDGEAWFGGDIDRAVLRTEGSGDVDGAVEAAEVQALYSRAIGPYADLQAGLRQDLGREARRTYAALGIEGLLPYMLDAEARLFLSTRGELTARVEGWYDQRIAQRLILQPRVELNLSAQDVPATRTGAGLSDAELGLRLRYEVAREFAPYVGLSYDAALGRTADYVRADRRDSRSSSVVAGMRFWF